MPVFIALDVQPEAEMSAHDICIELRRGKTTTAVVHWLASEPIDMRAGTQTALARVVKVFGAAQPHHVYLFAYRRPERFASACCLSATRKSGTVEKECFKPFTNHCVVVNDSDIYQYDPL